MSLLAAIDVGSNTIRLLIGEVEDHRIKDVYSDRRITRLGNLVDETGRLQDENMRASLVVLKEFSSILAEFGVEHVRAAATSALREASNSASFVKDVLDNTGIQIEVIPGEREAELTLTGVLLSFPDSVPGRQGSSLIVDIGGGSTEWILYGDDLLDMGSIPVGVIKLTRQFIKTDPVSRSDITNMDREIASLLQGLKFRFGHYIDRDTRFIGTAGTFTTIASVDLALDAYSRKKIHLHRISLEKLRAMSENLLSLPLEKRKKVKGLEPERADLIIPGLQFTIKVMDFFRFDELTVSDYGLLEGLLLQIKETIGKGISETGKS
jgi:exopolyphosphatase/guanosine-5'-triphosphate,3'-diphosphate pyrophosphatase